MRIGIDITFLFDQYSKRGIGRYGRELFKQLLTASDQEWVLFGFGKFEENLEKLGIKKSENMEFVSLGKPRPSNVFNPLYFRLFYLNRIKKAKLDIYLAPHFERGLPIGTVKTAVMMHDVIPYANNQYSQRGRLFNFLKGVFYKHNLNTARKADLILTNSDFSMRELINKGGFAANRIKRIYLGVDEHFMAANISQETRDIRRTLTMYNITKPYLLYYGGLEDNKNIDNMILAFKNVSSRFPDLKLVIAGKEFKVGWDNKVKALTKAAANLIQLVDQNKIRHEVVFTGELAEQHIPEILNNAEGFVHLSTYEGFGFSVLEAMAAGIPVIAARRSSYPEILGDAAELVNPEDVNKISSTILNLLEDDNHKQMLKKAGQQQAAKYTWANTAKETLAALEQIGNQVIPLRITYLVPYFYPQTGGAENNCLALAKGMAKLGHHVTVITSNTINENYEKEEVYEGIKIIRCRRYNTKYYLGFYPAMFGALMRTKSDIIHAHGFGFIWHDFCLLTKKIFSRHVIFINTPHGPFMANGQYSLTKRMFKSLFTFWQTLYLNYLYTGVIQVNPNQISWIKKYGINPKKTIYVPNGIYESYFEPIDTNDIIDQYGLGRKRAITFLGRFEAYKGLQDLIMAVKDLSEENKTIKLLAMGNPGSYSAQIGELIAKNQLEKQVEIIVSPDDQTVRKILATSEIFVLPSSWEAFGISILEAMAVGNAIISTRTEGGQYLIKEDENGFLYEFGDVNDLKSLIQNLLTNRKLLVKMRDANIEKAKQFTWEKIVPEYNHYLTKLR